MELIGIVGNLYFFARARAWRDCSAKLILLALKVQNETKPDISLIKLMRSNVVASFGQITLHSAAIE